MDKAEGHVESHFPHRPFKASLCQVLTKARRLGCERRRQYSLPQWCYVPGCEILRYVTVTSAERRADESNTYTVFYILRKFDALLQPIRTRKDHAIFITLAKMNGHREFLCEMLRIYLRVVVNCLHCESKRLFDCVSLRSRNMQHKNISVPPKK